MQENKQQLILFVLDNSSSMAEGFGDTTQIADRVVQTADRFLGGALGNAIRGPAGGIARQAVSRIASKVNVLNVAFNGTLLYLNRCRNTPADDCCISTLRYGSHTEELFPPTPASELAGKTGLTWFAADLGMTNTVEAFKWAAGRVQDYLSASPGAPKPWIIHITDGMWNDGGDPSAVATELMGSCLVFNALIDEHSDVKMSRREFTGYANPADVQFHLASKLVQVSSSIPPEWIEAVREVFPNIKVESRLFFPAGSDDLLKGVFEVVQEIYRYLYGNKNSNT